MSTFRISPFIKQQRLHHLSSLLLGASLLFASILCLSGCRSGQTLPFFGTPQTLPPTEVTLFFSKSAGSETMTEGVVRSVPQAAQKEALTFSIQQLLKGPSKEELAQGFYSEIPQGTRLLGVTHNEKGVIINLSSEFAKGGGATAMQDRLKQLSQTIQAVEKQTPVFVSLNGTPLTTLGGEGLDVEEPINGSATRSPQ